MKADAVEKTVPSEYSWASRPLASDTEVDAALRHAVAAQRDWRRTSVGERVTLVNDFVDAMLAGKIPARPAVVRGRAVPSKDDPKPEDIKSAGRNMLV